MTSAGEAQEPQIINETPVDLSGSADIVKLGCLGEGVILGESALKIEQIRPHVGPVKIRIPSKLQLVWGIVEVELLKYCGYTCRNLRFIGARQVITWEFRGSGPGGSRGEVRHLGIADNWLGTR